MKHFFLFFLAVCAVIKVSAQQAASVDGAISPNAASLGTFGSIPVSYYTGTPDISIPLHTVKTGNISLPVSLKYHPANVKPNDHPGWVGLGWNLQCNGVISRVRHGWEDESNAPGLTPYFPGGIQNVGSASTLLSSSFFGSSTTIKDVEADEFSFNFLDYSGKFIWTAQGWKVMCNKNIKVITGETSADFISAVDVGKSIEDPTIYNINISWNPGQQSRMFYQFTLVTDDGTKYIFGNDKNAIEYNSVYGEYIPSVCATSWFLTKIIDINNNTIDFTYHRKYPVCVMSVISSEFLIQCTNPAQTDWSAFSYNNVNTDYHTGYVIFPVYLTDITSKNEKITFATSLSTELTHSDDYYHCFDESHASYRPRDLELRFFNNVTNPNAANFNWEQLDNMQIKDNKGVTQQQLNFTYSASTNQRLTLNSLIVNALDPNSKPYIFNYNNIENLPLSGGNYTDHWGYFNNKTVSGASYASLNPSASSPKSTNNTLSTVKNVNNVSYPIVATGLICKMTYPTGGYTTFDWEANDYSKVVSTNRSSTVSENGITGGCRIKEIKSYDNISSTPSDKKYFYVSNYLGNGTTGLSSSGILNGKPQYYFIVNRPANVGILGGSLVYQFGSLFCQTNYSYNAFGSHIGYSEVVEQNADNSYTIFGFTNYELDNNNVDHFDKLGIYVGWDKDQDAYIPTCELSNERGIGIFVKYFNSNKQLVEKLTYAYDNNATRFNKYFSIVNERFYETCDRLSAIVLASSVKIFNYKYNLLSTSDTKYDLTGQNPVTSTTTYNYNPIDQVSSVSKSQNDGSKLTKLYKYVNDYSFKYVNVDCDATYIAAFSKDFSNWNSKFYDAGYTLPAGSQYNLADLQTKCYHITSDCLGFETSPGDNLTNCSYCVDAYHNLSSDTYNPIVSDYNQCLASKEDRSVGDDNYLPSLQQKNILAPIVEETNIIEKGSIKNLLFSKYYDFFANGIPNVTNVYEPLLPVTYDPQSMGTCITNDYFDVYNWDSYKGRLTENYDKYGNLIVTQKSRDIPTSYIWGYNNSYPTNKLVNCDYSHIAFTSFENCGGYIGTGGDADDWHIVGGPSWYRYTDASNDNYSMGTTNSQAPIETKNPLPIGTYKLSYYCKAIGDPNAAFVFLPSNVNISGGNVGDPYIHVSTWKHVETTLTVTASTKIQLNVTNAMMDDLKLYPSNALITTYTYKPLVGMSSSTDNNGRTTYYTYDSSNRLSEIKDADGNVLKHFDYNYKQ